MTTDQYNFDGFNVTNQVPSIVSDESRQPESLLTDKVLTRAIGVIVDQTMGLFLENLTENIEEKVVDVDLDPGDFLEVYNLVCDVVEDAVLASLNEPEDDLFDEDEDEDEDEDDLFDEDEEDWLYQRYLGDDKGAYGPW